MNQIKLYLSTKFYLITINLINRKAKKKDLNNSIWILKIFITPIQTLNKLIKIVQEVAQAIIIQQPRNSEYQDVAYNLLEG